MGKNTNIQWCDDTVSAVNGCPGCELWSKTRHTCYAGLLHEGRLANALPDLYAADFTDVRLAPGRMVKAVAASDLTGKARPGKPWLDGMPRMIFVGDMSDTFSESVPFEYIHDEVMASAMTKNGSRHIQLWLTKRPARAAAFALWMAAEKGVSWPDNVWIGTSITSRASLGRIDEIRKVPARYRYLSAEPLIEDVGTLDLAGINQVIIGGESGPGARPFHAKWARSIRDQCDNSDISFFMKQMGAVAVDTPRQRPEDWPGGVITDKYTKVHAGIPGRVYLKDSHGGDWDEFPADLRVRQVPARDVYPVPE